MEGRRGQPRSRCRLSISLPDVGVASTRTHASSIDHEDWKEERTRPLQLVSQALRSNRIPASDHVVHASCRSSYFSAESL